MPSYLIGIVAGNLVETDIGPRVSIVTEHSWVERVASELKDVSKYVSAAEEWVKYPYVWGKYTLVILPPNFPYGIHTVSIRWSIRWHGTSYVDLCESVGY